MKFAVTGGAGFIGSYLVKQLVQKDHDVIVIDNLCRGTKENLPDVTKKISFHEIDIRDFNKLKNILNDVDGIFHEAALTHIQESFTKQKEYHDVNVIGTENIFKIAKEFGLKVVYASSSNVYGNPEKIPIKENSIRKPINPYGNTKIDDEILAEKFANENASIIGLRYFNVYGKGQTGSYAGVITKFINNLKDKKPPIIFGSGTQVRDFIFVEDIAQANIVAMESKIRNGFFNVGTGIATSIQQLAQLMIDLAGFQFKPQYEKPLEGDVQASQADTTLTTKMLNWKYQTELKDGLEKFFPL